MTDQEFAARAQRIAQEKQEPEESTGQAGREFAEAAIGMVAAIAEKGAVLESEYLDESTGLLKCKICGGPRQTVITPPFEGAQPRTVRCWCSCPTDDDQRRAQERQEEAERRRRICFKDAEKFKNWDFSKNTGQRPDLSATMQQYAAQFKQQLRTGKGLLLFGDTGTGKSSFSAMIAHEVIKQGYKARMTNFETIEKALWDADQKAQYMRELLSYDLLVLDDLGAERESDYMQGIVYNVIDGRSRQGKPVVVTTNLSWDELTKTEDMGRKRIYERLLHSCLPVHVDGPNYRRQEARNNWRDMRQQLGMEARA